jgi:enoyl-[acyl-carrier protein] reductase I
MLLQGKRLLITGVLTPQSLAYGIAELAQQEGARSSHLLRPGHVPHRALGEAAQPGPEVLELDVTNTEHFSPPHREAEGEREADPRGAARGGLRARGRAGGNFLNTPWESVATAFRVSTFSLKELAVAVAPVMTEGGSIVASGLRQLQPRPGRSTTGWGCARPG